MQKLPPLFYALRDGNSRKLLFSLAVLRVMQHLSITLLRLPKHALPKQSPLNLQFAWSPFDSRVSFGSNCVLHEVIPFFAVLGGE